MFWCDGIFSRIWQYLKVLGGNYHLIIGEKILKLVFISNPAHNGLKKKTNKKPPLFLSCILFFFVRSSLLGMKSLPDWQHWREFYLAVGGLISILWNLWTVTYICLHEKHSANSQSNMNQQLQA